MTSSRSTLPGLFRYSEARALGFSKRALYAMRDSGEIEVVARGVYRRRGVELPDEELTEIALRAPEGALCLGTALSRHELSDEIPSAFDVAIPRGMRPPRVRAAVRWHLFEQETFGLGRQTIVLGAGLSIGQYSAERSIVDAFRTRGREGHDVAYEALRRWLRRPGAQPSALLALAAQLPRANGPLRHALEVLL